ncbi:MAG: flagellar biosynthesis protein FlhF [Candidatus Calescibacterium sp.]
MKYSVIKKFSGKNLLKIFEKIKEDTGGNGVLLGYEEKQIGGEKYYEVIVGILSAYQKQEEKRKDETESKKTIDNRKLNLSEDDSKKEKNQNESTKKENYDIALLSEISKKIEEIKREFSNLKTYVEFMSKKELSPPEIKLPTYGLLLFKKLISKGVQRNIALSITEDISKLGRIDEISFAKIIQNYLSFKNPLIDVFRGESKFLALVGPTGVGKTTTAAKISALYLMSGFKKVALLGTDRYRIGSVEQIKKYADIMGIPLFVAATQDEIKKIWNELTKFQFIVVDTMGKSQYDIKNIKKISSLIREIGNKAKVETCLLLSTSQREEEMINVMKGFSEIGIDYLIFTKVDETSFPGTIINIGTFLEKPIAFFTTGQSVPDDIKTASPKTLTELILDPTFLTEYATKQ